METMSDGANLCATKQCVSTAWLNAVHACNLELRTRIGQPLVAFQSQISSQKIVLKTTNDSDDKCSEL